jgi:enoyl-CoA hydratase/carnithine racemase
MASARALAGKVISAAPLAVSAILDLINGTAGMSVEAGLRLMRSGTVESYEAMLASEDAREGPAAFTEQRSAKWMGR